MSIIRIEGSTVDNGYVPLFMSVDGNYFRFDGGQIECGIASN